MQEVLVPIREPNLNWFSAEELDLVNDVINNLSDYSAREVSDLSHERTLAWKIADDHEEIPYETVFLSSRSATKEDIERGQELAKKYGWLLPAQ